MARKVRIQYPGAIYHVMNRGDHKERIFCDDQDRQQSLATLEEVCQKTAWQVHAFCLMSNHFHFVVETPAPNLVEGMTWFLGNYTRRFNGRHQLFGHLFSGRYKAPLVEGSGNGYMKTERLVTEALRIEDVSEAQWASWRKGHPFEVRLASRLRTETTVTVDWIAQRLHMGTRGHAAHLLSLQEHSRLQPPSSDQPTLNL